MHGNNPDSLKTFSHAILLPTVRIGHEEIRPGNHHICIKNEPRSTADSIFDSGVPAVFTGASKAFPARDHRTAVLGSLTARSVFNM